MTIEEAKKAGRLAGQINEIDKALYNVGQAVKDMKNGSAKRDIRFGNSTIYFVPTEIAIEMLDLLTERLNVKRGNLIDEIEGM